MTYAERKATARERAIEWQRDFENHNYSWYEIALEQVRLARLAARYGLIREFRENGII